MEWETVAQTIPDQVPSPETRVQNLLTSIDGCTDPHIATTRSAVNIEDNDMLNGWEKTISHLLPACPVASNASKKHKNANISGVGGSNTLKKVGSNTDVEV